MSGLPSAALSNQRLPLRSPDITQELFLKWKIRFKARVVKCLPLNINLVCHCCIKTYVISGRNGALPIAITSVTGFRLRTRCKLPSMPEGTQRCSRTKMVLPLRVWLDERAGETLPTQWAHTIEISHIGCRLGGLRTELSPGQTITLQRGQHKASFRVIWSKHLADNENQAGIEALDYGRNIWGLELPPSPMVESSTEPSCATGDSSATVASVPLAFVPKVSASTRSATHKFIPVAAHPRMRWGLSFGLLLLSVALALSLYQGRVAIQPPVPAPPIAEDLDWDEQ
jgi:hypothetical protein